MGQRYRYDENFSVWQKLTWKPGRVLWFSELCGLKPKEDEPYEIH